MKQQNEIYKEVLGIAYKEVYNNLQDINTIGSDVLRNSNFDFTTMTFRGGY